MKRSLRIAIVVAVIAIIAAGVYIAATIEPKPQHNSTASTSTTGHSSLTSSGTFSSSTTSPSVALNYPSNLTYEENETYQYLDPQVSFMHPFDYEILQNVYENLFWYQGSSGTTVIPWLVSSYSISPDLKTLTINLRNNVKFADGETLNSTAVYFSLYRLLIDDSSSPSGHGGQSSWIIQQLVNDSLSSVECAVYNDCVSGFYSTAWVQEWIDTNFVQIINATSFILNMNIPNAAWPYFLASPAASIVAPDYVMSNDISTWNASGYTLPYPTLSGNSTEMIDEYLFDEASTCNAGPTPSGCGATYLDNSSQGSEAGSGPYMISSVNSTGNETIVLQKNPLYWGGPFDNMSAHIPTIILTQVPEESTRESDLDAAVSSGSAMAVDIVPNSFYDIANMGDWKSNHTMISNLTGVSIYGPYTSYSSLFDPYVSNATNPNTGTYYTFQPFADYRFREAFSDAVNISRIIQSSADGLALPANSAIPSGLPPLGAYNSSLSSGYGYNPDESASLLLSAMAHPLTTFAFENGTAAPNGSFNNSFGCAALSPSGTCSAPISQSIVLYDGIGDAVDEAIMDQIATTIQNISNTYNMGLNVSVSLVPLETLIAEGTSGEYYMYALGWFADYPWSVDFTQAMYAPGGAYMTGDGWNYSYLTELESQIDTAASTGNVTGIAQVTNLMSQFVNSENLYLWTLYPLEFAVMTSNIHGYYFNPSLSTDAANEGGPELFAPLY